MRRAAAAAVRSLRPGAPSPDCEAADLAGLIVDVRDESELDDALRAARFRAGVAGASSWRAQSAAGATR